MMISIIFFGLVLMVGSIFFLVLLANKEEGIEKETEVIQADAENRNKRNAAFRKEMESK